VKDYKGGKYIGTTKEIENLRPKSPTNRPVANTLPAPPPLVLEKPPPGVLAYLPPMGLEKPHIL